MTGTVWLSQGSGQTFEVVEGSDQHKRMSAEGWQEVDAPESDGGEEAETGTAANPPTDEPVDLSKLDMNALRKTAAELGIPIANKVGVSKVELISAIETAQAENAGGANGQQE